MLARDIMTSPVITAAPEDDLQSAARRMLEHEIGCLPVLEGGRLVGMLSESDYQAEPGYAPFSLFQMPRLFERFIDMDGMERIYAEARKTPVSKVMARRPVVVEADAPVERVAALMLENHCHHVPVMRRGDLVGIIARRDLLKVIAGPVPGASGQ